MVVHFAKTKCPSLFATIELPIVNGAIGESLYIPILPEDKIVKG
jgi:hypothetical protein